MQFLAATTLFLAAEEEAEAEGIRLLFAPGNELFAGISAAVIIFLVIWKWFLPGFNEKLEARQAAVTEQLTAAEAAKTDAEQAAVPSTRLRSPAPKKRPIRSSKRLVNQPRRFVSDTIARANGEAEGILTRAREEAASEAGRALEAVKAEVGNISVDLAEKVVGQSLDRDAHMGLVNAYLADLEGDA